MRTNRRPPPWNQLLRTSPELCGLVQDAESFARSGSVWYPNWIGTFMGFKDGCRAAADRLGLDVADVRAVALDGLLSEYHAAKRRAARGDGPAFEPPTKRKPFAAKPRRAVATETADGELVALGAPLYEKSRSRRR